jgi:hypothetical protein
MNLDDGGQLAALAVDGALGKDGNRKRCHVRGILFESSMKRTRTGSVEESVVSEGARR